MHMVCLDWLHPAITLHAECKTKASDLPIQQCCDLHPDRRHGRVVLHSLSDIASQGHDDPSIQEREGIRHRQKSVTHKFAFYHCLPLGCLQSYATKWESRVLVKMILAGASLTLQFNNLWTPATEKSGTHLGVQGWTSKVQKVLRPGQDIKR